MKGNCKHEGCYPDTTCALGHINRLDCKHWRPDEEKDKSADIESVTSDIPWNSYSLGTYDLSIICGRGKSIVIGLVGAPRSGKTTLLAFLYMWLLENGKVFDWEFCGSWTLGSWESIVQNLRWSGEPPPSFPPHTTSSGRVPGLLHLSFRHANGIFRDVLFTDAPGEWFSKWAKSPKDESVAGARWVLSRSDAVLVLSDQEALADDQTLPQARREIRDLIERVGATVKDKPLGFVWTKVDIDLHKDTAKMIETSRLQFMPKSDVLKTTIKKPETIVKTLFQSILMGENQNKLDKIEEPIITHEPFLAYRRAYGTN